jgi:hypothetical protein
MVDATGWMPTEEIVGVHSFYVWRLIDRMIDLLIRVAVLPF